MGCKACIKSKDEDINEKEAFYKKNEIENPYQKSKILIKRNYSLSTDNSEDESYSDSKIENHPNLADDTEKEDDIDINEQSARNLVASLLENDFFFKGLLPTINSLSSRDFKKLFNGDCEHNYNSKNKAQLRRLAHKFDNFQFILKKQINIANMKNILKNYGKNILILMI